MRLRTVVVLLLSGGVSCAFPAELKPATSAAFDRYIQQTEQRLNQRKTFLWVDESPDRSRRVRSGEVAVEPTGARPIVEVNDGLIHDWMGAVFVPGVNLATTPGARRGLRPFPARIIARWWNRTLFPIAAMTIWCTCGCSRRR
ncbi:MAG: hypothetical protein WDO73_22305 [Ignavibacteriota bacterium]